MTDDDRQDGSEEGKRTGLRREMRETPVPLRERLPEVWPVLAFTLGYLALAGLVATRRANSEFLVYIAVMLVLIAFVAIVDRWVVLSQGVLLMLSTWGILHMAGGLMNVPESWPTDGEPALYNLWLIEGRLKYDQLVHATGFGVTTWACWQALRRALAGMGVRPEPGWGILLLCAMGGMGFGALNEVAEFAATRLLAETNVGGYVNTGWDLVANLVGCVTAVLLIRWFPHVRRGH